MLSELLTIKTNKLIWALLILVAMVLLIVTGCNSIDRSIKTPIKTKKPIAEVQFGSSPLDVIGQKIYNNETGGDVNNLIFWSTNEGFASLGVGHFIWYPEGKIQRFKQTFPDMIRYLKANGSDVPDWLLQQIKVGSLWNSREELEQARGSERFLALQKLLIDTSGLQVSYLFQRLDKALPRILTALNPASHDVITRRFNRLKNTPGGLYPLVDYVNFKGEGSVPAEGYKGEGWGLLQVLETMEDTPSGPEALAAFSSAAEKVLTRRVNNSPPERNEQRWLPGWRVRLMTYTL